jgi:GH24 family phage-related lysozyme (muramidase)
MRVFFALLFTIPFVPVQGAPAVCPPTVNSATISLIKEFEGFVPRPSPDPIGLPTVGYGHLCKTRTCSEAGKFPLTEATATTLLMSDLKQFTSCLERAIKSSIKLNNNQFGALASWTFNEGCGNMESSTLIRRLNAGENPDTVAAEELPKWRLAGGKVFEGLVRRRAAEVGLFETPSNTRALPC